MGIGFPVIHTTADLDMYGEYERIAMVFPHLSAAFVELKLTDNQVAYDKVSFLTRHHWPFPI